MGLLPPPEDSGVKGLVRRLSRRLLGPSDMKTEHHAQLVSILDEADGAGASQGAVAPQDDPEQAQRLYGVQGVMRGCRSGRAWPPCTAATACRLPPARRRQLSACSPPARRRAPRASRRDLHARRRRLHGVLFWPPMPTRTSPWVKQCPTVPASLALARLAEEHAGRLRAEAEAEANARRLMVAQEQWSE